MYLLNFKWMQNLLTFIAAISVKTKDTITINVAITLLDANIFLNWLNGPIRKQVLAIEMMFPNV